MSKKNTVYKTGNIDATTLICEIKDSLNKVMDNEIFKRIIVDIYDILYESITTNDICLVCQAMALIKNEKGNYDAEVNNLLKLIPKNKDDKTTKRSYRKKAKTIEQSDIQKIIAEEVAKAVKKTQEQSPIERTVESAPTLIENEEADEHGAIQRTIIKTTNKKSNIAPDQIELINSAEVVKDKDNNMQWSKKNLSMRKKRGGPYQYKCSKCGNLYTSPVQLINTSDNNDSEARGYCNSCAKSGNLSGENNV